MTARWFLAAAFSAGLAASSAAYAVDIEYTYDELGRVIEIVYPSGKTITYVYDDAGNRTQVTTTP